MSTIVEEIRSGNKDAVKAIYQEYAKDVYNFAKSITGDHDSALAATKKTFGKLIANIKKGDEPKEIRTALLKIAYEEACNIAMPSVNETVKEEQESVIEPAEENPVPRKVRPIRAARPVNIEVATAAAAEPVHEEIYMPKGGYDSLQVEETVPEVSEEISEAPRRRRPAVEGEEAPRRRRPAAEGEEAPRRRRPVEEGEEAPRRRRPAAEEDAVAERPRRRRPAAEEEVVAFPVVEDDTEIVEEEYEAPKARRKARPIQEQPVDVYDALDEDADDDIYEEVEKPRNKGLFIFCIILNIVLIIILLWFLGGLLVNLGVLPQIDIGYTWFNNHIYPLF